MARKKELLVEDILKHFKDDEEVVITFFAYGIRCGVAWNDGLKTAKQLRDGLRYDCLRALVGRVTVIDGLINIGAEIIH